MARLLPQVGALSPFLRRQLGPRRPEGHELGGWSEGMKSNASWTWDPSRTGVGGKSGAKNVQEQTAR